MTVPEIDMGKLITIRLALLASKKTIAVVRSDAFLQ